MSYLIIYCIYYLLHISTLYNFELLFAGGATDFFDPHWGGQFFLAGAKRSALQVGWSQEGRHGTDAAQKTKLSITRSIFELEARNFAWREKGKRGKREKGKREKGKYKNKKHMSASY